MSDDQKLAYDVDEACRATGTNRNAIYRAMREGALATFKIGRRRMISAHALRGWIERLERKENVEKAA